MKRYIKSSETPAEVRQSYLYEFLHRLMIDCEYALATSTDQGIAEYRLWAKNGKDQIAKMREIYNQLEIKPDWITLEDIDEYERRFNEYK